MTRPWCEAACGWLSVGRQWGRILDLAGEWQERCDGNRHRMEDVPGHRRSLGLRDGHVRLRRDERSQRARSSPCERSDLSLRGCQPALSRLDVRPNLKRPWADAYGGCGQGWLPEG